MSTCSPPAPPTTPAFTCRHCGQPLEALWQPPLLPGRAGFYYLTCRHACALRDYTFTSGSYPQIDLSVYLKEDQKHV